MNRLSRLLLVPVVILASGLSPQPTPVVHGLLFFSPSCPHCHEVIRESLPPIVEEYGESLILLAINTQTSRGQQLFRETGRLYGIPINEMGVPLLAVGDRVLIGSHEIPNELPGIIESGLQAGGIAWPAIEGLVDVLVDAGLEPAADEPVVAEPTVEPTTQPAADESPPAEPAPEVARAPEPEAPAADDPEPAADPPVREPPPETADPAHDPPEDAGAEGIIVGLEDLESEALARTPWQRFQQDRVGNTVALVVLLVMLGSLIAVGLLVIRRSPPPAWPGWLVGLIVFAGLLVAAYLAFVEVTQAEAVCGPVGDCNTVQQSPYARLFGLIPIGVLGFYGYAVLGLGWLLRDRGSERWNSFAAVGLWLLALLGTLFSVYLTVLEPFVIGATCMWCITSAILMTMLLWAATPAAIEAWNGSLGGRQAAK